MSAGRPGYHAVLYPKGYEISGEVLFNSFSILRSALIVKFSIVSCMISTESEKDNTNEHLTAGNKTESSNSISTQ